MSETRTRRVRKGGPLPFLTAGLAGVLLAYLFVSFVIFPPAPAETELAVPNVVGSDYDQAVSILEKAGFSAERADAQGKAPRKAATVTRQDPEGGTRRPAGTRVTLHMDGAAK